MRIKNLGLSAPDIEYLPLPRWLFLDFCLLGGWFFQATHQLPFYFWQSTKPLWFKSDDFIITKDVEKQIYKSCQRINMNYNLTCFDYLNTINRDLQKLQSFIAYIAIASFKPNIFKMVKQIIKCVVAWPLKKDLGFGWYAVASLGIYNHGVPISFTLNIPQVPKPQSVVKLHKIHGFKTPNFQIHRFHGTHGSRPNEAPDMTISVKI